ncbi:MAG: GNAT family N-acetyltransferase [Rhodospirillaceae bacterium]
MISIITEPSEVIVYIDDVQKAADRQKKIFGFLAKSAYEQRCLLGKLWVAIDSDTKVYAGHIMFGGTYPQLRVFQVNVASKYRRKRVGIELVEALKSYGEGKGYSSISARVAEDLVASNNFWAGVGFNAFSLVEGGKTTKRKIIVRVLQLDVPSLFEKLEKAKVNKITDHLRFGSAPLHRKRTYAIDLNVLFDLVRTRERYDDAAAILRGAMSGSYDVYVTKEMLFELDRTSRNIQHDPILELVKNLPVLPDVQAVTLEPLVQKLRPVVFPDRSKTRTKAVQDNSDLAHLAMAIHHELDGFITREKLILSSAGGLQSQFNFEILSSADFSAPSDVQSTIQRNPVVTDTEFPSAREFQEENRADVKSFLNQLGISDSAIKAALKPGNDKEPAKRYVLKIQDEIVGFSSWCIPTSFDKEANCYLFVEESRSGSLQFTEHILESFAREVATDKGRCLYLYLSASQPNASALAENFFYLPAPDRGAIYSLVSFQKYSVSGLVTPETWSSFVQSLYELAGVKLDSVMPNYDEVQRDGIKIIKDDGKAVYLDLIGLESYVTNVLVLFRNRPGIILPIRPAFSEELLGKADDQHLLFGNSGALLKVERTYFRSPIGSAAVLAGDPLVFYSSERAKAAIGCARVTFSEVINIENIDAKLSSSGVLSDRELAKRADNRGNIHMISFDGFQQFTNPVSYSDLKKTGAGKQNFITIEKLEPITLKNICLMGFGNATK